MESIDHILFLTGTLPEWQAASTVGPGQRHKNARPDEALEVARRLDLAKRAVSTVLGGGIPMPPVVHH